MKMQEYSFAATFFCRGTGQALAQKTPHSLCGQPAHLQLPIRSGGRPGMKKKKDLYAIDQIKKFSAYDMLLG